MATRELRHGPYSRWEAAVRNLRQWGNPDRAIGLKREGGRSRQIDRDRKSLACFGSIPGFRGLVNMGTAHTSYLVAGSPRITHIFSLKFLLSQVELSFSVIEVMKASVMVLCHLTSLVFVSPCFASTFIYLYIGGVH